MSEDHFIDFRCPYCGKQVSFPERWIGTVQDCPWCSSSIVVPSAGAPLGGKLPIPIATPRLVLRRLQLADRSDLLELMLDPGSFRYIDWDPLSEEDVEKWLERDAHLKLSQPGGNLCLALETSAHSKVIGFISLKYGDGETRQAGFSVMVNSAFRRKGYATEAVAGVLALSFQGLNLHRVAVNCDSRNTPARRMLEKAGMRREGEFLEERFVKEVWINTVYYAQLNAEHQRAQKGVTH